MNPCSIDILYMGLEGKYFSSILNFIYMYNHIIALILISMVGYQHSLFRYLFSLTIMEAMVYFIWGKIGNGTTLICNGGGGGGRFGGFKNNGSSNHGVIIMEYTFSWCCG